MSLVLIDTNGNKLKNKIYEKFQNIKSRKALYKEFINIDNDKLVNHINIKNVIKNIISQIPSAKKSNELYLKYLDIFLSRNFDSIDQIYNKIDELLNEVKKNRKNAYYRYLKKDLNQLMIFCVTRSNLLFDLIEQKDNIHFKSLAKDGYDVDLILQLRDKYYSKKSDSTLLALTITKYYLIEKELSLNEIYDLRKKLIIIENDLKIDSITEELKRISNPYLKENHIIKEYIELIKDNEKKARKGEQTLYNIHSLKDIFLYLIDNEYKPKLDNNTMYLLDDLIKHSNNDLKNSLLNIKDSINKIEDRSI